MVPVPAMVPPVADQVTLAEVLLDTVAVNSCVPPAPIVTAAGETVTAIARTVTVAVALRAGSATLRAVTWYGPPSSGAANVMVAPAPVMVPPVADQVTAGLVAWVTVAVNDWVSPAFTVALAGVIVTVTGFFMPGL